MKTKITASGGKGRPCNPHHLFENQDEEDQENLHEAVSNLRYRKFEETAITAPTFLNNQPFMEDGEFEAILGEQKRMPPNEKWIDMDDNEAHIHFWEFRYVWRILPPSQPVNLASGEQREDGMSQEDLEWLQSVQSKADSLYSKGRIPESDFMLLDRTIDTILENNGVNINEIDL